jgi:hypothetical protein
MNKTLFEKVKAKSKDTGLSEKYLKTITEKMGGSVEDDSTDEKAIEEAANLIAEIAVETQGEATRWASKKNSDKEAKEKAEAEAKAKAEAEAKAAKEKQEPGGEETEAEKRIKAMEAELAAFKAEQSKGERAAAVKVAQEKHKIPEWRMKGVVVPDDQNPDEYLAGIKQDLITQGLVTADAEGVKTVPEKAVDQAADSLLESITVK